MSEISADELYDGLLNGMIADRLPPMFTMADFIAKYCVSRRSSTCPSPAKSRYISFDSMRNTGEPRRMGIPSPFSYEILCRYLKQEWGTLKRYLAERTKSHPFKISQIHIRKQKDSPLIFRMNYPNRWSNNDIIPDIRLTSRFCVESDISTFFPSIYTHALEWAITTRNRSKANLKMAKKDWGQILDEYVRSIRDGETSGLLIGPHASNLISEIILTRVDEILCAEGYKFVRRIDDYECYVDTHDEAERFLSDLKNALSKYNLSLNYKKTFIKELPLCVDDAWKQQLKAALTVLPRDRISKDSIATFLDILVGIMKKHNNGAVFSYAVKALSRRYFAEDARQYYVKFVLHLAYCYPYLYQYLDEYLFYAFDVESNLICNYADQMFKHGGRVRNFEECTYSLYFAIKYAFTLSSFDVKTIIGTQDCILLAMAWYYASCRGLKEALIVLHGYALSFTPEVFEENWLFAYEALGYKELTGAWKTLKKANVTFFKRMEDVAPLHTPGYESFPILWSCRIHLDDSAAKKGFESLYLEFKKDNPQYANIALANEYLQCIVGNLLANSRLKKNVLIYRTESHYEHAKPFGSEKDPHDCRMLKDVLNWLKAKHYVGERVGTRQTGGSCFWPKDTLCEKFKEFNLQSLYRNENTPLVVLKDRDKNVISPTPMSAKERAYSKLLQSINSMYDKHQFACRLHGTDVIDIFRPRLKAVFNDANWEHGGRLYASATMVGFNYQCVPSDMRKEITIDGGSTAEVDYSGMHPHLLYAQLGLSLTGNPYDFLPPEDKSLAKFVLLVMLNAKSKKAVVGALEKRLNSLREASGLSPKKRNLRDALLRNSNMIKIIDDAAKKHQAIRSYFYRGTGIRLQNIESSIALAIVHHFSNLNIPVLPVHDSFIIAKRHRNSLMQVMQETYRKQNNGFSCPVK